MGHSNREESNLQAQVAAANARADAAEKTAATPDPMEQRRRDYLMSVDDWRTGKSGPIDVRNLPGGGVGMSLRQEAMKSHDAGRLGRGLATLSDGASPSYSADLDKEMQLERDLAGAGALEDYVDNTLSGVDAEMGNWANVGNSRNMSLYDAANSRTQQAYGNLQNYRQNKQPSFFKQLALGAIGSLKYAPPGGVGGIAGLAI
jgi:hypothetical protein